MNKADRPTVREAYPEHMEERLRFADTDLVGHVNNASFATFFETGRVAFLFDPENPLFANGDTFVLARLNIDFLGELHFPGMVTIASGVSRIGSSSATIMQALFSGETCVGTGESVVVMIDGQTRKAKPLPPHARDELAKRMLRNID
jgi:acyl-CoA thioester hydrolase